MLLLTGRDVWEGIVKLGWLSGSYDPKTTGNAPMPTPWRPCSTRCSERQPSKAPHVVREHPFTLRDCRNCTATRSWVSCEGFSLWRSHFDRQTQRCYRSPRPHLPLASSKRDAGGLYIIHRIYDSGH
jgi:hypothetical protein